MPVVVALAGRRIDAPGAADARFPPENVLVVEERLRALFVEIGASALVSSAACGADLIALQAAGVLHLRRRIVLPCTPSQFRDRSVTDRPGDWGPLFDRIVGEVTATGDLVVLDAGDDDAAFAAANEAILDEAARLATPSGRAVAVIVWNGRSRGPDDVTAQFRDAAKSRKFDVHEVSTL